MNTNRVTFITVLHALSISFIPDISIAPLQVHARMDGVVILVLMMQKILTMITTQVRHCCRFIY